ncbi:ABC transporter permease [Peptoniphilus catoniae]|uniref:ABC transporter permease n=1 Tax=Peptoniphilus catoniae TaxID=1660341 RepID=UPI0015D59218|nr:ABC transporter permease subunit [Peptoniphilus catoniae]
MKRISEPLAWFFCIPIWGLISLIVGNDLYLPGPIKTLAALFNILASRESYIILVVSSIRVAFALFLALAVGLPLGFLTGFSPKAGQLLNPWLTMLKSVPVVSFIMLALLWLNSNFLPILISFLMAMPIFWTATEASVISRDKKLLEMMEVFEIKPSKRFINYDLPWAIKHLSTALRQATGLAFKAGVAAEVLSFSPFSIGRKIMESKTYLETADLFAWTLLLVLLSFAMERLVQVGIKSRKL